jgi:hypothetical protein
MARTEPTSGSRPSNIIATWAKLADVYESRSTTALATSTKGA